MAHVQPSPLTTKGDIVVRNNASPGRDVRLPVGTDGLPIVADSAAALGIGYSGSLLGLTEIGIGTSSPDRKLEIIDASNPAFRITHTDGTYYTDFQHDTVAWFGGLNILPTTNAEGAKAVNLFGIAESSALSILDDGTDFWLRTTRSGTDLKFNSSVEIRFLIGFGSVLQLTSTSVAALKPLSCQTLIGSDTTSECMKMLVQRTGGPGAGVGFGGRIDWLMNDDALAWVNAGDVRLWWEDPTNGAVSSAFSLYTTNGGSRTELVRFSGDNQGVIIASPVAGAPEERLDVRGNGQFDGDVFPRTDDNYDLGTTTLRWATVFTMGLNVQGGVRTKYDASSTTPYNASSGSGTIVIDSSGGPKVVDLPSTSEVEDGFEITVKREGANTVTLNPDGSNTVEGAASLVIGISGDSVTLMSNGGSGAAGDWKII